MKWVAWIAVVSALSVVATLPAVAADNAGDEYQILGQGTKSCGAWTQDHKPTPETAVALSAN